MLINYDWQKSKVYKLYSTELWSSTVKQDILGEAERKLDDMLKPLNWNEPETTEKPCSNPNEIFTSLITKIQGLKCNFIQLTWCVKIYMVVFWKMM